MVKKIFKPLCHSAMVPLLRIQSTQLIIIFKIHVIWSLEIATKLTVHTHTNLVADLSSIMTRIRMHMPITRDPMACARPKELNFNFRVFYVTSQLNA